MPDIHGAFVDAEKSVGLEINRTASPPPPLYRLLRQSFVASILKRQAELHRSLHEQCVSGTGSISDMKMWIKVDHWQDLPSIWNVSLLFGQQIEFDDEKLLDLVLKGLGITFVWHKTQTSTDLHFSFTV